MKSSLLTLSLVLLFLCRPQALQAGPLRSEIVTEQLAITVPAGKAMTITTFSQPVPFDNNPGFVSFSRGEQVVGPVLISYVVNNGGTPPMIKDVVIAGPAVVSVIPPNTPGGVAFLSYKIQAN